MALVLAGCGGGDDKPAPVANPVCESGRVAECPCEGGAMGIQACKADGSAWGMCACQNPNEVPELACTFPRDPATLIPADRCPANHDMYGECEPAVVTSGACFQTKADFFCCAKR